MDYQKAKNLIFTPALKSMDKYSDRALSIALNTCAQESHLGEYDMQVQGPAIGIGQMEPITYDDLWTNYLLRPDKKELREAMESTLVTRSFERDRPTHEVLRNNYFFAVQMTRVAYLRFPEELPEVEDIPGQAAYWKKYYNTKKGKGTEEEFIKSHYRLCK